MKLKSIAAFLQRFFCGLAFLLFAFNAQAITVVQSASANNASSPGATLSVSFSTLPSAGHSVIVIWSSIDPVGLTGVADNQSGNTYSSVVVETSSVQGVDSEIWWLPSVSGSSGTFTVTGTTGSSNQYAITILEVSGLTGVVDKTGTNTAGGGATSITVTASGGGRMLMPLT
jgi:hypothetical protein